MAASISRATLALYAFPTLGPALLNTLTLLYLFKYATDVLLIAPAAMGVVFMVGRLWDAASDPLAGYLSDRTRTRWGRRRPWFAAAVPLFAVCPVMVWAPPAALDGFALLVWVAAGMLALRANDGREMDLELFKFDSCPYCRKVQKVVDKLKVPVTMRDTMEDASAQEKLLAVGGDDQVPCLFIDGKPMYESDDIVEFLEKNFLPVGPGKKK